MIKTLISRWIEYSRYYKEPNKQEVLAMARESARSWFKNANYTSIAYNAYINGYIKKYREVYAKNKMKS